MTFFNAAIYSRRPERREICLRLAVLFVALLCIVLPKMSYAMTVSPVVVDFSADPQTVVEKKISIKNDSKAMAYYTLNAENFQASGEEGQQEYTGECITGLASWFALSTSTIAVKPGETVSVPIKISIPSDAGSGGHYATVFVSRSTPDSSAVGLHEQIGVLFLANISGEIVERASIESFRLKGESSIGNRLPFAFALRIRNEGGAHIRPEGNLVVKNLVGRTVALLPINASGKAILPRSVRRFDLSWGNASAFQKGSFWQEAINELKNFGIGRYTVEVRAAYGEQRHSLNRDRLCFWIVPWHLLAVFAGLLALFLVVFKIGAHCYVRCVIKSCESRRKMKSTSASKKK